MTTSTEHNGAALSIIKLKEYGGTDASLIIALLLYFVYKHKHTTSNIGLFDLDEFCNIFKYHRSNLLSKHPNPLHVQQLSINPDTYKKRLTAHESNPYDEDNYIYDNVIGNALYKLSTDSINFQESERQYEQDGIKTIVNWHKYTTTLTSLKIHFANTRSRFKKIYFDYELDSHFINNMSLFFCGVSFLPLAALRRANIDELYIFLRNLQHSLNGSNTAQIDFNDLCSVSNIYKSSAKDAKKHLVEKFKKLNSIADVPFTATLSFAKSQNSRYAYTPIVTFTDKAVPVQTENEKRVEMLTHTFQRECLSFIEQTYPDLYVTADNVKDILLRFLRSDKHMTEKANIYIKARLLTFGTINYDDYSNAEKRAELLRGVTTIEDIELFLTAKRITTTYGKLANIKDLKAINTPK